MANREIAGNNRRSLSFSAVVETETSGELV
jgi:hypothetical protein